MRNLSFLMVYFSVLVRAQMRIPLKSVNFALGNIYFWMWNLKFESWIDSYIQKVIPQMCICRINCVLDFSATKSEILSKLKYRISLNNVLPWIMSPLNSAPLELCPLFWKTFVHKKGTLFKFLHFWSLLNVLGHYLRKYGTSFSQKLVWSQLDYFTNRLLQWALAYGLASKTISCFQFPTPLFSRVEIIPSFGRKVGSFVVPPK